MQIVFINLIDKYSFGISAQYEQGDRAKPDFFIEVSAWVFVESTTC